MIVTEKIGINLTEREIAFLAMIAATQELASTAYAKLHDLDPDEVEKKFGQLTRQWESIYAPIYQGEDRGKTPSQARS